MIFTKLILLIEATRSSSSGCSDPIPAIAITSLSGSTGYSIECTGLAATTISPDQYAEYEHYADEDYVAPNFVERRHKKHPLQNHLGKSFLRKTRRLDDSIKNICFTSSTEASMGFLDVNFDADYVIRSIDFEPIPAALFTPTGFALNSQEIGGGASWYVSQADAGSAWTSVPIGSTSEFTTDFASKNLHVFPKTNTPGLNGNAFSAQFRGCLASNTAMVSFRFTASLQSIKTRFGSISVFVDNLQEHVCLMTKLVSTPQACSRILFANIQETAQPSDSSDGVIRPSTVPNVEVYFRVLPPNLRDCADCRSAAAVQANLVADLATPTSAGAALLRAVDSWIADADPYLCYQKACPTGTLCVSGVCVTPSNLVLSQAESTAPETTTFTSGTEFDSILNMSPLDVIDGVDQSAGRLVFNHVPVSAGVVVGTTGTTTPTTTSSDDFLDRYFIPIVVLSSIGGLILIFIGFKVYQRSQLTAVGRAVTA